MKYIAAILLAGLLATSAQAKPHWGRIALKTGALVLASIAEHKATIYCQRGNPEVCALGYGGHRDYTFNWLLVGIGAVAIPIGEKCHSDDGPKPICYALDYGTPATQTAFGIHDYLSFQPKPKGEHDEKINLRSFAGGRSIFALAH